MSEECTLELRIDRFSEFAAKNIESQLVSVPGYIHGFVWRIVVKPWKEPNDREIFLECTGGDDVPNWSCQASVALHFVSQKEGKNDYIVKKYFSMSKESDSGLLSRMSCKRVLDPDERYIKDKGFLNPDNGYIKDNTVIFRVHVKAEVPRSVRIAKLSKFASSISDPPDCILIVGTNRIPIHKTYLSFYSEYFKTMFRSKFKEGREDEIVLEDVEYGEMIELLAVIYPSMAPVTGLNLKYILKLADRFIIPAIMERCEKELRTSNLNGAQKLLLAQMYNFEDLQIEFAQQYKSAESAMKLRSEPEYSQLDHKTLALVLNSIAY